VRLTIKFAGQILLLLLLWLLESGCTCTHALWANGHLVACKEPAQYPNLNLFESRQRGDFLVVYDEYSERTDSVHRRAYWLNRNQSRVENEKSPVFARPGEASRQNLAPVPVFYSKPGTVFVPEIYAVCDTNEQSFALFSAHGKIGSFNFPVYNDRWGNVEKVALTPVAVTADVTVAGGMAAIYIAYGLGESGYAIQIGK
jgi:hypothetical protein